MNAPAKVTMAKHFIDLSDFDTATLRGMLDEAKARKDARAGLPRGLPDADATLKGRVPALMFDKHSTRTRISIDVGMTQLGGSNIKGDARARGMLVEDEREHAAL